MTTLAFSSDTPFFDLDAAPLDVAGVTLVVRDLAGTSAFYRDALGLAVHASDAERVVLGAQHAFLTLLADPGAAPDDRTTAGLFHTAFLLPERGDLGRWLAHAAETGIALDGASDHNVSEALYLADPEGNGIEIYADRPLARWRGRDGALDMPSRALNLRSLMEGGTWTGAPAATRIGHVHLRDPDPAGAERSWGALGFEVMARYPGASFLGAGGYHHQLAANAWQARRPATAGRRAGLAALTFRADETILPRLDAAGAAHDTDGTRRLDGPGGVALGFVPKGAARS